MMKRVICLALLATLAVSSQAAEYLYYSGPGKGLSGSVSGWDSISNGGYSWGSSTWNGQLKVQYKNEPGSFGTEFRTFCITPDEVLGSPDNPWKIDTPILINGGLGTSVMDRIARLVSHGTTVTGVSDIFGSGISHEASAAFQLALWRIVNNDSLATFNSGLLTTNTTVLGIYNDLIGLSNDTTKAGSFVAFYPNPLSGSQILITGTAPNGGGYTPVPEPFTMGLGLATAGAFIRRRVKAKKVA